MSKYVIAILGVLLVVMVLVITITGLLLVQSGHKISSLQTNVEELEKKKGELEGNLASSEKETDKLRSRLGELEGNLASSEKETDRLRSRLIEFEAKQNASAKMNEEFVVEAGKIYSYTFSPKTVPGTLFGSWESSGKGYGGYDDTIAAFRLTDPKDGLLQSYSGQSKGNFVERITSAGTYTFFFDNVGPLRSTARRIFFRAEYRPD